MNSEPTESSMHEFCTIYNLNSLYHKSTCYKNPKKQSCIDLFLTNSSKSFQNTQTIETGLSDFHKLVVTILKMYLPNNQPKVITYRDYKNFDNSHFSEELLYEIKKLGPLNKNISIFHNTCIAVLEKYAPEKRKYIRANQANFMDSKLNHAIMLRCKLLKVSHHPALFCSHKDCGNEDTMFLLCHVILQDQITKEWSNDQKCEVINNYFNSIVKKLNIPID